MAQFRHHTVFFLLSFFVFFLVSCSDSKPATQGGSLPSQNAPQTQTPAVQSFLIQATEAVGGHSAEGRQSSLLCQLALQHANDMAAEGQINHDGFDGRSEQIESAGGSNVGEIVAENYADGESEQDAANSCAQSWRNSPGHWALMSQYWDNFCYQMVQANDGTYYCIGLFANGSVPN